MEPEEISVVLARASHLHSKLNEAIHSILALNHSSPSPSPSSSPDSLAGLHNTKSNASELHSLVSIRDSLELLEEHLDSLQALQLQQRAERDFGLAEIEESRRIFLKRLREHTGRELEIIQEAFMFAGGTPSDKKNVEGDGDDVKKSSDRRINGLIQRLDMKEGQQRPIEMIYDLNEVIEEEEEEECQEYEEEGGSEENLALRCRSNKNKGSCKKLMVKMVMGIFLRVKKSFKDLITVMREMDMVKKSMGFLGQIVQKANGNVRPPASKGILVVAMTIMLLSLTNFEDGKTKKSSISRQIHRSRQAHQYSHVSPSKDERLRQSREGDHVLKCFVRERIELPSYKESQMPDVLHGRG